MLVSLPMAKLEQAKPSQWRVSNTTLVISREALSQEQLRKSLTTLKTVLPNKQHLWFGLHTYKSIMRLSRICSELKERIFKLEKILLEVFLLKDSLSGQLGHHMRYSRSSRKAPMPEKQQKLK